MLAGRVLGYPMAITPFVAWATNATGHADPVARIVLTLALVIVAAKLAGEIAVRLGQPEVLGELLVGILLGNLPLAGLTGLEYIETEPAVDMLARIGVLLLLFEVGLESTVQQMLKVGVSSLLVALLGVLAPFALGWWVGAWLLPSASSYAHAFLGATLTATSVGITARVLRDLGRSQTPEARIILGAAVIDDVLGLVILAVVSGVIAAAGEGQTISLADIGSMVGKAAVFLVGSLALGAYVSPKLFGLASKLKSHGVLLALGLAFCFSLSWAASRIGLAPIVGAFAAGLVLEPFHFRDFVDRGEHPLEDLVHPITSFLVPIFFVLMGMRTDLRSFAEPGVVGLAAALAFVAILGKQLCSLGVVAKGIDRLTVGIGMIPRGEVGLIFANVGLTLSVGAERIIDHATFSAVVVMVIVTTMATPPALKWSLMRHMPAREA
jgi:Kef-type K+ transport system membrane component KefB